MSPPPDGDWGTYAEDDEDDDGYHEDGEGAEEDGEGADYDRGEDEEMGMEEDEYYDDGDRSISLDLFRKSLALSRRNGDVLGQATCREGIADVLMDMDDAKSAMAQAAGVREKEAGAFAAASADLKTNIGALDKAIPAIENGMGSSFEIGRAHV